MSNDEKKSPPIFFGQSEIIYEDINKTETIIENIKIGAALFLIALSLTILKYTW